jgi:predicted CoA-binding protein
MIEIGDEVVNSIDKNRLDNDQVLRKKVEVFNNLKNLAHSVIKINLDKDIEEELLRQLANSIREIETQLDIVAPN